MVAGSAWAFSSEEWLGKRELFAREAERLRAAYTNCVAHLATPADEVTIPVETFDDGSVKVMIFAKKAQYFLDKGLVWAEDVTIPVEMFDDGSVKVMVFAKKAQYFLDKGLVWAEDVTVRRFKPDGTLEACIEAKNCVIDRFSKSGWAEGLATVSHGKTVFRGRGIYFSSPEGYIKVLEGADVDSQDLKFGGAL